MFAAILTAVVAFAVAGAAFGMTVGVVVGGLALAGCGLLALYTDLFDV